MAKNKGQHRDEKDKDYITKSQAKEKAKSDNLLKKLSLGRHRKTGK